MVAAEFLLLVIASNTVLASSELASPALEPTWSIAGGLSLLTHLFRHLEGLSCSVGAEVRSGVGLIAIFGSTAERPFRSMPIGKYLIYCAGKS